MPTAQIETRTNESGSVPSSDKPAQLDDNDLKKQQIGFIICRALAYRVLGLEARAKELEVDMRQALNGHKSDAPRALAALCERERQMSRRRRQQLQMIDRALALVGRIMTRDLVLADVWEKIEANEISMQRAMTFL